MLTFLQSMISELLVVWQGLLGAIGSSLQGTACVIAIEIASH